MGAVKAGICIRVRDDQDDREIRHLYVVLNDPDNRTPQGVAIVRFRSYRAGLEPTLILKPGEHPFVIRPTCVEYIRSKIVEVSRLEKLVQGDARFLHPHECSPELLKKIRDGLFKSDFVRARVYNYCKEVFGT